MQPPDRGQVDGVAEQPRRRLELAFGVFEVRALRRRFGERTNLLPEKRTHFLQRRLPQVSVFAYLRRTPDPVQGK